MKETANQIGNLLNIETDGKTPVQNRRKAKVVYQEINRAVYRDKNDAVCWMNRSADARLYQLENPILREPTSLE